METCLIVLQALFTETKRGFKVNPCCTNGGIFLWRREVSHALRIFVHCNTWPLLVVGTTIVVATIIAQDGHLDFARKLTREDEAVTIGACATEKGTSCCDVPARNADVYCGNIPLRCKARRFFVNKHPATEGSADKRRFYRGLNRKSAFRRHPAENFRRNIIGHDAKFYD